MAIKCHIPDFVISNPPPRPISKYEAERSAWNKVVFHMRCHIVRESFDMVLSFSLPGSRYDKFIGLEGTFSGITDDGREYIISLSDTDVIEVLDDNRDDAKTEYKRLVDEILANNRREIIQWDEKYRTFTEENTNSENSFWKRIRFKRKV